MFKITATLFLKQFNKLIESILPAQCLICNLPSNNKLICDSCKKPLTLQRPCCHHCGLSLPTSQPVCGDCLKQTYYFTQLHALAEYYPPYPKLIKQFKYSKQLIYGELLAELLIDSINASHLKGELSKIDYLIPVPLHKQKLQKRGFNQAQLIAEKISNALAIPLILDATSRKKQTIAQENLSLLERKYNLKDAFSLSDISKTDFKGKYIVIIDDVVTTGSTVNSLCDILQKKGVKRVDVWCLCRTQLPQTK